MIFVCSVIFLKRHYEGAKYEDEDRVKSLYLDGSGAYATTPAVDLGTGTSFTIASWVKLQGPVEALSPIYTDWVTEPTAKFFFVAYYSNQNPVFGILTNTNEMMPAEGYGG